MSDCDGPYVCPYPNTWDHQAGDHWTCPGCGSHYKLSRPVPERRWRNWSAPHGHWELSFRDRVALGRRPSRSGALGTPREDR